MQTLATLALAALLCACGGGEETIDDPADATRTCVLDDGRNLPEACK